MSCYQCGGLRECNRIESEVSQWNERLTWEDRKMLREFGIALGKVPESGRIVPETGRALDRRGDPWD